jgi:hypothetical protein
VDGAAIELLAEQQLGDELIKGFLIDLLALIERERAAEALRGLRGVLFGGADPLGHRDVFSVHRRDRRPGVRRVTGEAGGLIQEKSEDEEHCHEDPDVFGSAPHSFQHGAKLLRRYCTGRPGHRISAFRRSAARKKRSGQTTGR